MHDLRDKQLMNVGEVVAACQAAQKNKHRLVDLCVAVAPGWDAGYGFVLFNACDGRSPRGLLWRFSGVSAVGVTSVVGGFDVDDVLAYLEKCGAIAYEQKGPQE